jgi:hypothetical protein
MGMPRHRPVYRVGRDPALDEVPVEDPLGDLRHREGRQRPAHVPTVVAALQAPGEHDFKRGARHHAELTRPGHRPGQSPVGDGDAHATLDDRLRAADDLLDARHTSSMRDNLSSTLPPTGTV